MEGISASSFVTSWVGWNLEEENTLQLVIFIFQNKVQHSYNIQINLEIEDPTMEPK